MNTDRPPGAIEAPCPICGDPYWYATIPHPGQHGAITHVRHTHTGEPHVLIVTYAPGDDKARIVSVKSDEELREWQALFTIAPDPAAEVGRLLGRVRETRTGRDTREEAAEAVRRYLVDGTLAAADVIAALQSALSAAPGVERE